MSRACRLLASALIALGLAAWWLAELAPDLVRIYARLAGP